MAEYTTKETRAPKIEEGTEEFVLTGSRYCYRDNDNVLVKHRRGDKVKLNREQVQRLRAGQPGSPFQHEADAAPEIETEMVATANEATLPAEEDGFRVSPVDGGRKRPVTKFPEAKDAPATREEAEDRTDGEETIPEPVTSTRPASKTATRK